MNSVDKQILAWFLVVSSTIPVPSNGAPFVNSMSRISSEFQ
jgi:hypothetical protein